MVLSDIRPGMRVRLLAPRDHPLYGHTGVVTVVIDTKELWRTRPMDMLGEPFAWLRGQVLISLYRRPRDHRGHLWTPTVIVGPESVEEYP